MKKKAIVIITVVSAIIGLMVLSIILSPQEESVDSPRQVQMFANEGFVDNIEPTRPTTKKPSAKQVEDFLIASFTVEKGESPSRVRERAAEAGALPGSSAATLITILFCEDECLETRNVQISNITLDNKDQIFAADIQLDVELLGPMFFDCYLTPSVSPGDGMWNTMECFRFDLITP